MNVNILEQVAIGFIQVLPFSLTLDSNNITKTEGDYFPYFNMREEIMQRNGLNYLKK